MSTLSDSEAVKIAVNLCNDEKFKKIILFPRLVSSLFCSISSSMSVIYSDEYINNKKEWDLEVEKEASCLLKNYSLEKEAKEKIVGAVFSIALRMLTWTEFYMGVFNFSREFCFDFLKEELFSTEGIIDEQKVAEKLMSLTSLSRKQKFKVACYYCFTEQIPTAFKSLTKKEKEFFYNSEDSKRIKQLMMVKFWSYYLMGDINRLRGHKSIDQYRLKCAIASGSKMAVEFCLKKTGLIRRRNYIVDAGVEVIKFRLVRELRSRTRNNIVGDYVVFRSDSFNPLEEFWVPDYGLADILYFLFEKMTDDQRGEMIKKFYEVCKAHRIVSECPVHIRCFEYFLFWPYQGQFMELVKYTLPYLNERAYCVILLEICHRIDPEIGTLGYGESNSCDYRKLLVEFWQYATEDFIRYAFRNKIQALGNSKDKQNIMFNEGEELIFILFLQEHFTMEDRYIIKLILKRATGFEKKDVLLSAAGNKICRHLLKKEKWELFDEFILMCARDHEEALEYRTKYLLLRVKDKCYDFILNQRWSEAEEFMKWCDLSESDKKYIKREMIKCDKGRDTCLELCLSDIEVADQFVKWCLLSEEEAKIYKHCLLFFYTKGIEFCEDLVVNGSIELLNNFVHWCLSSEAEVKKFKKKFVEDVGYSVCTRIFLKSKKSKSGLTFDSTDKKSEWTLADGFLSWCFTKNSDVTVFKKNFFKNSGGIIYFELIRSNKCFESLRLFSWVALPSDEIKKLRRYILFDGSATCDIFDDMMASNEDDKRFVECGGKRKAIEQILKWCLVDKEALVEFKARYRCYRKDAIVKRVTGQLEEKFDDEAEDGKTHQKLKNRVLLMK